MNRRMECLNYWKRFCDHEINGDQLVDGILKLSLDPNIRPKEQ